MKIIQNGISIDLSKKIFIIAELSANHNQQFDLAMQTINAAHDAGADAIKLQTYTPDTITIDCDNDYFQINHGSIWDGTTLYKLYQEAYTPWEWQPKLKDYAESLGMILFSSPFDHTAVDFLEKMEVPAYKIASFEITDIPLIEYVASKGKPIIMSTGVATLEDIQDAISACQRMGNNNIVLLKCTSAYPTPMEEMNLLSIPMLAARFNTVVGLSDHSIGSTAAITSVALGSRVLEKHFILDRKQGGPDATFSMEPAEFRHMVDNIRDAEKALGTGVYELTDNMIKSKLSTRSLFVVKDIKKGELLTVNNVRSIRPGHGLLPKYLPDVLGKSLNLDAAKGTPLDWDMINKC